jgi:hypothetical protein
VTFDEFFASCDPVGATAMFGGKRANPAEAGIGQKGTGTPWHWHTTVSANIVVHGACSSFRPRGRVRLLASTRVSQMVAMVMVSMVATNAASSKFCKPKIRHTACLTLTLWCLSPHRCTSRLSPAPPLRTLHIQYLSSARSRSSALMFFHRPAGEPCEAPPIGLQVNPVRLHPSACT